MRYNRKNLIARYEFIKNCLQGVVDLQEAKYPDPAWHRERYWALCDAINDWLFCWDGAAGYEELKEEIRGEMVSLGLAWMEGRNVGEQLALVAGRLACILPSGWGVVETIDRFWEQVSDVAYNMMNI